MAAPPDQANTENTLSQEEKAKTNYAEFEAKVKRTVYLDNLSPQVTTMVVKSALGQVGTVINVEFLPNYTIPFTVPQSCLVEMESERKVQAVLDTLNDFPFMMSGMPRPVRAQPARPEMFLDQPRHPRKRPIPFVWAEPGSRNFDAARKVRALARRHKAESLAFIKIQLEEEEKLAKQQQEMLNSNYKKYERIEKVMQDGTFPKLSSCYGINLADD